MKSPTKAIDSLWRSNFFKEKKQTREVILKISTEFEINPSNISDLLKKRPYLRNKNGWIQKYPGDKEEDIQVYYFEPGKPRSSRENFIKILNKLSGSISICDPYLNKDSLTALEEIKNANVKFLTSSKKENIKVPEQDLKDFKKENSNIEIKGFEFDHLHDRYIILKDRILLLGHGFSIRNKESFIIELPDKFSKDLIQSLKMTFDTRWKNEENRKII